MLFSTAFCYSILLKFLPTITTPPEDVEAVLGMGKGTKDAVEDAEEADVVADFGADEEENDDVSFALVGVDSANSDAGTQELCSCGGA